MAWRSVNRHHAAGWDPVQDVQTSPVQPQLVPVHGKETCDEGLHRNSPARPAIRCIEIAAGRGCWRADGSAAAAAGEREVSQNHYKKARHVPVTSPDATPPRP